MSTLFIPLYLDEDVHGLLPDLLRARGFDVVSTQQAGNIGLDDAAQLAFAVSHSRTLLTHNRADFEALAATYSAQNTPHAGILIAVRRPIYELTRRVLILLNAVTADEMHNQVRYL